MQFVSPYLALRLSVMAEAFNVTIKVRYTSLCMAVKQRITNSKREYVSVCASGVRALMLV